MASKAELFRLKADEAEAQAAKAKDYEARRSYLEIARQWREMADQAERNKW